MLARLIFFIVAAAAASGSAAIAGLIATVVGLSIHLPTAILITWTAGAATTTFGAAVTLSSMAASLFFSAPEPSATKHPDEEHQRPRGKPGSPS